MPGSTASLESLSSPSPSPPPAEEQPTVSTSTSNHSGAAGLDSGSELSELTEDEQDNDGRQDDNDGQSTSARSRQKKRGIVPVPMWGWVPPKKDEWKQKQFEEEEEEEQAGPVRPMEEEEDDERGEDRGRLPSAADEGDRRPRSQRLQPPALSDNEEEDEDDDGRESEDETLPHIPAGDDPDSAEEEEDDAERDVVDADALRPLKRRASPDLTEDEEENIDDDDEDEGDGDVDGEEGILENGTPPPNEVDYEDEDGELGAIEDPEMIKDALPVAATHMEGVPVVSGDKTVLMDVDADLDVDEDADADESARPSAAVTPIAHPLAAASSIMAGADLVQEAPSPSPSSSASGSPSSSRSPSPEPVVSDREPEPEPGPQRKAGGSRVRTRKAKTRTRTRKAKVQRELDADGEADLEQHAELEADDRGGIDAEDADEPELELESDLQPAHRAEALDVLATIELKFALLRERLYVEKMDVLAWEETLVAEGSHPELLHLHTELSSRRNKRIELATRKRDYEIANVTKRRKLDEDAVWSTWKRARDDLQTEMISETNRKRRKLERERRMMERPQPVRRIPNPPLEISAPPTLREIIKSYPFGTPASTEPSRHSSQRNSTSLTYPQLSALSHSEVVADLELLYQPRRANTISYDVQRPVLMNTVLSGMPHPYEPFGSGMPMLDGPGTANRFGPPPPAFQHQHAPPHGQIQGPPMGLFNPGSRTAHHHPTANHLHHVQGPMDQDLIVMHRPASGGGPPGGPHMHQFSGAGPVQGPGPGNLMRRSISPVPVQSLSNGAGPAMSVGMGINDMRRLNGEPDGRERDRERDRYANGIKARERADRERELELERAEIERGYPLQLAPRHVAHQHPHSHIHSAPGQAAHHQLGPHHHHHHHHHVVHHHPVQPSGPGLGLPPPGGGLGQALAPSPHHLREIEPRRPPSGASMDVDLSASGSKPHPSPLMSSLYEQHQEFARERGRPPPGPSLSGPGPHDRLVAPFGMPPSQPQNSYPSSPRNGPGPPGPSGSNLPSRRSSWGAQDESLFPRPSSSASHSHVGSSHTQNAAAGYPRLYPPPRSQRPSSTQPPHGSPPLSNGRPLHMSPPSSTLPGSMRPPSRSGLTHLPPPPILSGSAAHSPPIRPSSPLRASSPGAKVRQSPVSPSQQKGHSRSGIFSLEQQRPGANGVLAAGTTLNVVNARTSDSVALFPPHGQHPPPRLSSGGLSEKHSPRLSGGTLAPKIVPVDGS